MIEKEGLEGLGELLKASDEFVERMLGSSLSQALKNHVGQEQFKKLAEIHASSGKRFPHTILIGNPGLGKTYLAKAIAKRLGGRFRYFIGTDLKPSTVHQIVKETIEKDIIFIDEIHSIHRDGAEILYDVIQDFLYLGNPSPPFTMIGATTDIAKVPKPLRERCWIHSMELYSVEDLVKIIKQHYPDLPQETATECAKRSHGVPRIALQRLALHADAARGRLTWQEVFKLLGVDNQGLLPEHRLILQVLSYGKPIGLEELSFLIDAPKADVVMYEAQLIKLGLIARTHRGRVITQAGLHYGRGGDGLQQEPGGGQAKG